MSGLAPLERRLLDGLAARDAALRDDLAAHVAIPTGRGFTEGLDRYRALVRERLERLGATIDFRDGAPRPAWLERPGAEGGGAPAPVLVARHPGPGPKVLLVGHLDTVHDPHGDFRTLDVQPDGVHAVGPGAVDMKGGVLVMIGALEALAEAGVDVAWTVVLNSDEETGSFSSEAILRAEARGHDVGLVFEPALPGGALAIERMGSGQFHLEVRGRGAHVGRAFTQGVSAVTELARLLIRVDELADPAHGAIVNVGPIVGGAVTNAVPDHAAAWGNLRFADAATGERLVGALRALATAVDAMPQVTVHAAINRPAKPCTEGVRGLATLARAAAEDLGQALPFTATGGVCDGNLLQAEGLPVLDTLGVRGGNLHRLDEFVELPSIVERAALTAVLLHRLAVGAS